MNAGEDIAQQHEHIQDDHTDLVRYLAKKGSDIQPELSALKIDLWHMATGVSGESGEVLDLIKKHVIYGKELDMDKLIEEMGDVEFYLEGIRQALHINREQVLARNINKLTKRFGPDRSYSDSSAIRQDDAKTEVQS